MLKNIKEKLGKHLLLFVCLAALGLTILFVNPIRETAMEDDWAYALTVQHLIETGHYKLHDWASANMPFQIYWGSLFARVLGYSHSSLRISTLALVFCGLIAFYYLAQEHRLNNMQAGLLTLCLLSSPLVLRFSFNFMTDVPFLMCVIISLLLYTRAIRLNNFLLMLLASVAASAAILTRQFGVALIVGVACLWLLDPYRKQRIFFYLLGLVLPFIAGMWQLAAGLLTPTWAAQYSRYHQTIYFARPVEVLINAFWRSTVILQYLALFSLPLLFTASLALAFSLNFGEIFLKALIAAGIATGILAVAAKFAGIAFAGSFISPFLILVCGTLLSSTAWFLLRLSPELAQIHFCVPDNTFRKRNIFLLIIFVGCILAGILYGYFAKGIPALMPYISWNFDILKSSRILGAISTFFAITGGILLAHIFASRYFAGKNEPPSLLSEQLLDLVTFFLLAMHLIYFQIGDEYLLIFLPFTLIVVGRHLKNWLHRFAAVTALACLVMLTLSAMWARGLLSQEEAHWQGCEFACLTGAPPETVSGPCTWVSYHRFDDYMAQAAGQTLDPSDLFGRWLPQQKQLASFLVTESADLPSVGRTIVVQKFPYRNALLQKKYAYVLKK